MVAAILALSGRAALAQEPIALDEIKPGELTDASPQASFDFVAAPGQNVEVEVLTISQGMVPQFTVLQENDAVGVWYAISPQTSIKSTVTFAEGGAYRIVVGTTNQTVGQFVITLRAVVPPPMLVVGAPSSGPLSAGASVRYVIQGDPSSRLTLTVDGQDIAADLYDSGGEVLGSLTNGVAGGGFYLPGGSADYSLEVHNPGSADTSYQLTLTPSE
jgi:hypothetical protein